MPGCTACAGVVDFLRSCYSGRFYYGPGDDDFIIGRYFFAAEDAEVIHGTNYFSSPTWLDDDDKYYPRKYQTLEELAYYSGEQPDGEAFKTNAKVLPLKRNCDETFPLSMDSTVVGSQLSRCWAIPPVIREGNWSYNINAGETVVGTPLGDVTVLRENLLFWNGVEWQGPNTNPDSTELLIPLEPYPGGQGWEMRIRLFFFPGPVEIELSWVLPLGVFQDSTYSPPFPTVNSPNTIVSFSPGFWRIEYHESILPPDLCNPADVY